MKYNLTTLNALRKTAGMKALPKFAGSAAKMKAECERMVRLSKYANTLAGVARSLNIDPKVARDKARRLKKIMPVKGYGPYTPAELPRVKTFLTTDHRS